MFGMIVCRLDDVWSWFFLTITSINSFESIRYILVGVAVDAHTASIITTPKGLLTLLFSHRRSRRLIRRNQIAGTTDLTAPN